MTTSTLSPEHILETGLAFWASKTLLSAVEFCGSTLSAAWYSAIAFWRSYTAPIE